MLDKICSIVKEKGAITTAELRNLGVTRLMINKYMEMGDLTRIKLGNYVVSQSTLTKYLEKNTKEVIQKEESIIPQGEIKLTTVYSSLLNGQVERAKKELEVYLENIGKTEYLNLGLLLIKYDILEKDSGFYAFIRTMAMIDADKFVFSKEELQNAREEAINRNEMRKAWLYQSILDDAETRENTKKLSLNK